MSEKKLVRKNFRLSVFKRDRYACKCCGAPGYDAQGGEEHLKFHFAKAKQGPLAATGAIFYTKDGQQLVALDAHHIINRDEIISGGFIKENGITLCPVCHLLAEKFHQGEGIDGYMPLDLFRRIGSSEEIARKVALIWHKRNAK